MKIVVIALMLLSCSANLCTPTTEPTDEQKALANMMNQHTQEMQTAMDKHEQELKRLRAEHEKEMETMKEKHKKMATELRNAIREQQGNALESWEKIDGKKSRFTEIRGHR